MLAVGFQDYEMALGSRFAAVVRLFFGELRQMRKPEHPRLDAGLVDRLDVIRIVERTERDVQEARIRHAG